MGCQAVASVAPEGPRETLFGIATIDIMDLHIQNQNGQLTVKQLSTTLKMSNQTFRSKSYQQTTVKEMNERVQFIVNSRYQRYGRSLIVDVLDRGMLSETSIGVGMLDLQYIITDKKVSEMKVYLNKESRNVGWISIRAQFQQIQAFPITLLFESVLIRRKTGSKKCKIRTTIGEEVLQTSTREDRQDQPPQWKDENFTFYVLRDRIKEGKVEVLDGDNQIGSILINLKEVQASLQSQIQIKQEFHYQEEIVAGTIKFIISKGSTIANKDKQIKQPSFISPSKRKLPPIQIQKDTHLFASQKIQNQKEKFMTLAKPQNEAQSNQVDKKQLRKIQVRPNKQVEQNEEKQKIETKKKEQLEILAKQQQERAIKMKQEQQQRIAKENQAKRLKEQEEQLARQTQAKRLRQQKQKTAKQQQLRKVKEEQEKKAKERQQEAKRMKEEQEKKAKQQQTRKQKQQEERLAAKAKAIQQKQRQEERLRKQKEELQKAEEAKRIKQQEEIAARQRQAQILKEQQQKIAKEEHERKEREQIARIQQYERKQRQKQAQQEAQKAKQHEQNALREEEQAKARKEIQTKAAKQNEERRQREEKERKQRIQRQQHEKNVKREEQKHKQQHKQVIVEEKHEESKPKEQHYNTTNQVVTVQQLPPKQQAQNHPEHDLAG